MGNARGRHGVVRGLIVGLVIMSVGVGGLWVGGGLGGVEAFIAFVLASLVGLAFAGVFDLPVSRRPSESRREADDESG